MTREELIARIRHLEELLKLLQQASPKQPTRH